ncbi:MAG: hypothetical protein COU63_01300 [Candidatus Pacebacteria bacterium CG10_big_fil_rev_8_21_14_0_10_36_11]|nr:hypothetical protein [Candidatus Pacearchaeota archaeon]OIP73776.1 MAG: hypothetical protein AUK08_04420 [Candidatus Pacebacteria bacterium CG2_30_36_39]PIR64638.1 MAG: hypothetical protein COU63_01300 [Candidatus Pacebacteria bacterium CG10_big_fil_rev_8_21_14_0_10_36_11]PJC43009.1 MAG: hypothetical protein CO040_01350 [Candidatus Pacebacteria bacterium CG_4_9_14_0_2_um_filter_36_8]
MKQLLTKPITILFLSVISLLFFISLRKTAQKSELSQKNVEILEQKIEDNKIEIEEEKKQIFYASSEFAIDKLWRDELLNYKPGEYVLQIPLEEKVKKDESFTENKSAWENWLSLFQK